MNFEEIVKDVLRKSLNGEGKARNESIFLIAILESNPTLISHQSEVKCAIKNLVNKGEITINEYGEYILNDNPPKPRKIGFSDDKD